MHITGDTPMWAVVGYMMALVLGGVIKCYQAIAGPIYEKEWDEAAEGARWAVATGQTKAFAIGQKLNE